MTRNTPPARSAWGIGLGLAIAYGVLVACAQRPAAYDHQAPWSGTVAPPVARIGGPRMDHAAHMDRGLDCTDCHEPREDGTGFLAPSLDLCMQCHEDIDGEWPAEQRIARTFFTPDQRPRWVRALVPVGREVIFSHKAHEGALECTACHGAMAAPGGRPQQHVVSMAACMDCHTKRGAANACATCHRELRAGQRPASHTGAFLTTHGRLTTGPGGAAALAQCALCHGSGDACKTCHERMAPRSHRHLWKDRHGEALRAGGPRAQRGCETCHDSTTFCERCHQVERPRSHTRLFCNRTHGAIASMDRQGCRTCHTTDFCVRCHEHYRPRSHRAGWSTGRSRHCVQCHYPISHTPGCQTCHQQNPSHATAPAMPPGHQPNWDCRTCHNTTGGGGAPPMRHLDNGMDCRICHR